mgnify:CR=1 FL=1
MMFFFMSKQFKSFAMIRRNSSKSPDGGRYRDTIVRSRQNTRTADISHILLEDRATNLDMLSVISS